MASSPNSNLTAQLNAFNLKYNRVPLSSGVPLLVSCIRRGRVCDLHAQLDVFVSSLVPVPDMTTST